MISGVLLRDATAGDLPIFFAQQLDPAANQMAAFPARDKDTFMAHWSRVLDDGAIAKKTIVFAGQVAGYVVCFELAGKPLIGYWIGKEFWGKGIATKALSAFLADFKTRPLYAHVAKYNVASIRVLEKCGFELAVAMEPDLPEDDEVEELVFELT